ncbi:MAG: MFS transporter [Bacteroidetes bacterium]|nr:MFS transporter [Bacteroidota bacterium]
MKSISKTVWVLSIVSLLTDTASEMLYPILPIYLKTIGFSVALIGILEGLAEAVAGLSKGYFGKGIRTGTRDAILSEQATPQTKGKIFGFHRSMDTLGADLGPSLALLYLY